MPPCLLNIRDLRACTMYLEHILPYKKIYIILKIVCGLWVVGYELLAVSSRRSAVSSWDWESRLNQDL